jgi:TRAP-type mannitol/chloroaromatic compound transport system permease large subunit
VLPFIIIQLLMLVIAYQWPALITWLPAQLYG